MTTPSEPHQWTLTQTLAHLRAGRIGAVELLDHMLERHDRLNPAINAVVTADPDAARAAARAADNRRGGGRLAGLPMTVKESFDTVGFATTSGIPPLAGNRPGQDALAVARLRAEGAVIWGKTNLPEATSDHQSYNDLFGLSRNPWNLDRTVGGSSGGSAAALAAGLTVLELGSDIGGSIRLPAHFCGVWGLKPSYGIVPQRGHVPPMPGTLSAGPLSVVGPMARSAADLGLALDILAGAAPGAPWQLALPAPRHRALRDFRVALWAGDLPVDPDYAAAIHRLGDVLAAEGVSVTRLDATPAPQRGREDLYLKLLFATIGSGLPPQALAEYAAAAQGQPEGSHAAILARATHATAGEFAALIERQAHLIADWARWFEGYDILLCPVSMTPAFPHQVGDGHGPVPQIARRLEVGGRMQPYLDNLLWPGVATLAELPSVVRPLPERVRGLPVGVQMIGPGYGDRTALAFAALCDQVLGGFVAPPGFG